MNKIIDKTGGLTNLCAPRIFYTFHKAGETVEKIIYDIKVKNKSTRTFEKSQLTKALKTIDVRDFLPGRSEFKLLFLAKCVAGHSDTLIQVSYTKNNKTFTIDGLKYDNREVLPDVCVAYAFD